jgi:hypothetical protein
MGPQGSRERRTRAPCARWFGAAVLACEAELATAKCGKLNRLDSTPGRRLIDQGGAFLRDQQRICFQRGTASSARSDASRRQSSSSLNRRSDLDIASLTLCRSGSMARCRAAGRSPAPHSNAKKHRRRRPIITEPPVNQAIPGDAVRGCVGGIGAAARRGAAAYWGFRPGVLGVYIGGQVASEHVGACRGQAVRGAIDRPVETAVKNPCEEKVTLRCGLRS